MKWIVVAFFWTEFGAGVVREYKYNTEAAANEVASKLQKELGYPRIDCKVVRAPSE